MKRADHFRAADQLVAKARRRMAATGREGWSPDSDYDRGNVMAWLAAAQVHATLAAAGRDVEAEVEANERAVSAAVVSAEETRVRLLGGSVDPVVEAPAYGTEPTDNQRARATTCRCTGLPHDLGSPGCSVPGMNRLMGVEETAGTVRPKPGPPSRLTCHCSGVSHERGAVGCAHEVRS